MKKILHPFILFVLCMFAQHASAQNILLKADTFTKDGSIYDAFRDYVEIHTRQFGITSAASIGAGAAKPVFQDLVITKSTDKLSNKLMDLMVKGEKIANMEILITVKSADGNARVVVNKVQLKDVFVTSASNTGITGCENGCDGVEESFKFAYTRIRITTFSQDQRGAYSQDPVVFEYNVETGRSQF